MHVVDQMLRIERPREDIDRPFAHRQHRRRDIVLSCDDDDRLLAVARLEQPLRFNSGSCLAMHVDDDASRTFGADMVDQVPDGGVHLGAQADGHERFLNALPGGRIVIEDEHGLTVGQGR